MDKKLRKECIDAVLEAALEKGWDCVLNRTLNDIVEDLDDSVIETPEQAVTMYSNWVDLQIEYGLQAPLKVEA